ncbi:MAG: phosphoribosylanthranilate isomerase [Armatimonadota bacterium]|nr:phosphoribosylanthranilate isomerase [Armatimonadota bacterium]MCX7777877.1 phosphoribosylanthranilate isomerase [Armatimonadota bacterium]MDW8025961.1 phosphoribosylanthranilate isomerase [Armatimonadota bacterium]
MCIAVKICGMTNEADIMAAASCDADYIGIVVDVPSSPRSQGLSRAAELSAISPLPVVTVTVNMQFEKLLELAAEAKPTALQLHGEEPPELVSKLKRTLSCEVWKAIKLPSITEQFKPYLAEQLTELAQSYVRAGSDVILLDASPSKGIPGGTGTLSHWGYAKFISENLNARIMLAGGLNPANVGDAIKFVRPWGVDVSSGVERSKGKKDTALMEQFVKMARMATEISQP